MKVVHISTTDYGGAYKATERISQALTMVGIESTVLVRTKTNQTDTIEAISTPVQKLLSKSRNFLNLIVSDGEVISDYFGGNISKYKEVKNADVIILHWVNSFVSNKTIYELAKLNKPIIWVMHDMWPFTGGCHYDGNCNKYVSHKLTGISEKLICTKCPKINSRVKRIANITHRNVLSKKRVNDMVDMKYVALCEWEHGVASGSYILENKEICLIANPLNANAFHPLDNVNFIKIKLNIPAEKHVVLFGADKISGNPIKGFKYLIDALELLDDSYVAYCFGNIDKADQVILPNIAITYLGRCSEKELIEWYNVSDVFVVPSFQETFCYTCCESLFCGTPVTAFKTGGLIDQVEHLETGYLAEINNSSDLAEGIKYCVNNINRIPNSKWKKFVDMHSYETIGNAYKELAQGMIINN